jgi:hypothetical protein
MKTALLIFILLSVLIPLSAQETYAPMHRLTWEEYVGTLTHWRQKFPKTMSLESRGISGQNMPVYLLKITDSTVPAADKQVCLITTLHSGPERTGTTGALAFAEWCLSDDPLAVETRRKQIILVMPCVNPLAMFYTDRFRNEHGVDPYTGSGRIGKLWDVKSLTLTKPEDAPELTAVLSVIDDYQPEVHADLHGTGLQEYAPAQLGSRRMYHGQIMTEVTGGAYSNYALRPWDWRVTEAMIDAGRAAGFPSDPAHLLGPGTRTPGAQALARHAHVLLRALRLRQIPHHAAHAGGGLGAEPRGSHAGAHAHWQWRVVG